MRYDRGYARGYDHGWHAGRRAAFQGYAQDYAERHYRGGRELPSYAGGMPRNHWDTAFGHAAYGSPNQHPEPQETDFLGRPYPPEAMEERAWGMPDADPIRRGRGYDRGWFRGQGEGRARGYDAPYRGGGGYAQDYGRPEDYHPRFMPDSDVGGRDAHRLRRGPMGHTSDWTRWF
jgi:hypothetical protein